MKYKEIRLKIRRMDMGTASKNKEVREQVSFKIPVSTKQRVDLLAEATRRSRTFVIEEAIEHYLSINEWQVRSIQQGLKDIDHDRVVAQESIENIWEEKLADTVDKNR